MFAWIISQHFDSMECLGSTQHRGGGGVTGTFAWIISRHLTQH